MTAYQRAQRAAELLGHGRRDAALLEQVHNLLLLTAVPPRPRAEAAFASLRQTLSASSTNVVDPPAVSIQLIGKVGHDFAAGGRAFSFMQVARKLRAADRSAHVCVTIDSSGGGAEEAVEIFHLLRTHKGLVTTIAKGECKSAAGLIFLAGGYRKAHAGTRFLIHPVAYNNGFARGGYVDAAALARDAKELQRQTDEILAVYTERCTASAERFQKLCANGRDFDVDVARNLGIVHAVIPGPPSRNHPRFHT